MTNTARAATARAAILRSLRARKALGRLWYSAVDEEDMVESMLSALSPSLGLADELELLVESHGARRTA